MKHMKRTSRNKTKNKVLDVIQTVWNDNIKDAIAGYPYTKMMYIQDKIHNQIWHQIKHNIFLKVMND